VRIEKVSGRRQTGRLSFGQQQTDQEIVETGHESSGITFGHPGSVFLEHDMTAMV
jgi:hypothetical protein